MAVCSRRIVSRRVGTRVFTGLTAVGVVGVLAAGAVVVPRSVAAAESEWVSVTVTEGTNVVGRPSG